MRRASSTGTSSLENILIGKDGEPRIADFGLARLVRGDGTLTRTDAFMGTPDYMAPEQRESLKAVDHRADIFSLGVVLYEMLTGQLTVGRFDPPARKAPVDARIDAVVLRALENDRERRCARAEEMGTDIRRITSDVRLS
jgi:serine/threonine-protein kinase